MTDAVNNIINSIFLPLFTSFFITALMGKGLIKILKKYQDGRLSAREYAPQGHLTKGDTPTMGGLMFILPTLISGFIYSDRINTYFLLLAFVMISYSILGFWDDYKKLKMRNSGGINAIKKLLVQSLIAIIAILVLKFIEAPSFKTESFVSSYYGSYHGRSGYNNLFTSIIIPYYNAVIDLSYLYYPFAVCVIVGASNSVNLSDGLDGLATTSSITTIIALTALVLITQNEYLAYNMHFPYLPNVKSIIPICTGLIGGLLGFLIFNTYPAKVFMGDLGSLPIGAIIGMIGVMIKNEIILLFFAFIFVLESLSVILQISYYRLTKKRIFKMTPLHHHFEESGVKEQTIVAHFVLTNVIGIFIGFFLLFMS